MITTDDVCLENLKFWHIWDNFKKEIPHLIVHAFVIANFKNEQNVAESKEFQDWYEERQSWVIIGVHGYDHLPPPEQERDDAEDLVVKSLEILRPFLPEKFLYRPPGFQRSVRTEPMLIRHGFAGIVYQTRVKWFFDGIYEGPIFNTHCCDRFLNPITKVRREDLIPYID